MGVSGTDFITRSIENLLAKVRALATEGVSTWMYTSNYRFPPSTMSGEVAKDIFMVPECLGVKIAMGDHRSSFPTEDELIHLLSDIRLAGMISGKIGVLHIHSGNIPGAFDMYRDIVSRGFPIKHIRPTHCARVRHVFDGAVEFAKATLRRAVPAALKRGLRKLSSVPWKRASIRNSSRCPRTVTAPNLALTKRATWWALPSAVSNATFRP